MEKKYLEEYIKELKNKNILENGDGIHEINKKLVYGISCDSKEVVKQSIFICKGASFKSEYLEVAKNKGAFCYISDRKYDCNIPCILVSDIKKAMAIVSNIYYNEAKEKLNIIGITGTKGKSTTAYYIKYILDEYAKENLKKNTGIISSIKTYDGKNDDYSLLTTPESIELNSRFNNMVDYGIENAVMEVSSQALKYDRTYGIKFKIALFLNISEDHISPVEHTDFNDYFNSKLKIFEKSDTACINLDSDYSDKILDEAKKKCSRVITFSMRDKNADIYCREMQKEGFSTKFVVKTPKYEREFILNMPGTFNIENSLAAISVAYCLNIDNRFIYSGLKLAKTEGRMEMFSSIDNSILALVDYAHNKLSFQKVFESIKNEYPKRKIISVFGCPGDKAINRRVDLPNIADKYSNKIFITADDPGNEGPEKICNEIATNIKNTKYEIIIDRKQAIKKAIDTAEKNSIVLVLGKGAETIQKCGNKKEEYLSDIYYVKEYLEKYSDKVDINVEKC